MARLKGSATNSQKEQGSGQKLSFLDVYTSLYGNKEPNRLIDSEADTVTGAQTNKGGRFTPSTPRRRALRQAAQSQLAKSAQPSKGSVGTATSAATTDRQVETKAQAYAKAQRVTELADALKQGKFDSTWKADDSIENVMAGFDVATYGKVTFGSGLTKDQLAARTAFKRSVLEAKAKSIKREEIAKMLADVNPNDFIGASGSVGPKRGDPPAGGNDSLAGNALNVANTLFNAPKLLTDAAVAMSQFGFDVSKGYAKMVHDWFMTGRTSNMPFDGKAQEIGLTLVRDGAITQGTGDVALYATGVNMILQPATTMFQIQTGKTHAEMTTSEHVMTFLGDTAAQMALPAVGRSLSAVSAGAKLATASRLAQAATVARDWLLMDAPQLAAGAVQMGNGDLVKGFTEIGKGIANGVDAKFYADPNVPAGVKATTAMQTALIGVSIALGAAGSIQKVRGAIKLRLDAVDAARLAADDTIGVVQLGEGGAVQVVKLDPYTMVPEIDSIRQPMYDNSHQPVGVSVLVDESGKILSIGNDAVEVPKSHQVSNILLDNGLPDQSPEEAIATISKYFNSKPDDTPRTYFTPVLASGLGAFANGHLALGSLVDWVGTQVKGMLGRPHVGKTDAIDALHTLFQSLEAIDPEYTGKTGVAVPDVAVRDIESLAREVDNSLSKGAHSADKSVGGAKGLGRNLGRAFISFEEWLNSIKEVMPGLHDHLAGTYVQARDLAAAHVASISRASSEIVRSFKWVDDPVMREAVYQFAQRTYESVPKDWAHGDKAFKLPDEPSLYDAEYVKFANICSKQGFDATEVRHDLDAMRYIMMNVRKAAEKAGVHDKFNSRSLAEFGATHAPDTFGDRGFYYFPRTPGFTVDSVFDKLMKTLGSHSETLQSGETIGGQRASFATTRLRRRGRSQNMLERTSDAPTRGDAITAFTDYVESMALYSAMAKPNAIMQDVMDAYGRAVVKSKLDQLLPDTTLRELTSAFDGLDVPPYDVVDQVDNGIPQSDIAIQRVAEDSISAASTLYFDQPADAPNTEAKKSAQFLINERNRDVAGNPPGVTPDHLLTAAADAVVRGTNVSVDLDNIFRQYLSASGIDLYGVNGKTGRGWAGVSSLLAKQSGNLIAWNLSTMFSQISTLPVMVSLAKSRTPIVMYEGLRAIFGDIEQTRAYKESPSVRKGLIRSLSTKIDHVPVDYESLGRDIASYLIPNNQEGLTTSVLTKKSRSRALGAKYVDFKHAGLYMLGAIQDVLDVMLWESAYQKATRLNAGLSEAEKNKFANIQFLMTYPRDEFSAPRLMRNKKLSLFTNLLGEPFSTTKAMLRELRGGGLPEYKGPKLSKQLEKATTTAAFLGTTYLINKVTNHMIGRSVVPLDLVQAAEDVGSAENPTTRKDIDWARMGDPEYALAVFNSEALYAKQTAQGLARRPFGAASSLMQTVSGDILGNTPLVGWVLQTSSKQNTTNTRTAFAGTQAEYGFDRPAQQTARLVMDAFLTAAGGGGGIEKDLNKLGLNILKAFIPGGTQAVKVAGGVKFATGQDTPSASGSSVQLGGNINPSTDLEKYLTILKAMAFGPLSIDDNYKAKAEAKSTKSRLKTSQTLDDAANSAGTALLRILGLKPQGDSSKKRKPRVQF